MRRLWFRLKAFLSTAPVVIVIERGKLRSLRGALSGGVLREIDDVVKAVGIDCGLITVAKAGQGTVLRFSGRFDAAAKQRIRNIWFAQPVRKI